MLVDSHCHLNFPDFKDDLPVVIERARKAGVTVMQTICTEVAEFEEVYAIAEGNEGVYASVGVHPNETGSAEIVDAQWLIEQTKRPKVIGIGETGLDYFYETADREYQKKSLNQHIIASRETDIPLIIHTRNADEDTAEILQTEMKRGAIRGVLHCFTSSKQLADIAVECGFYVSFSGIATFKNAQDIRDTLKDVPFDRLLVETDAPYLAPMPHRGKRNEPAYTIHTNRLLAEVKGISEEEAARITTENFFRLFNKAKAL